MTHFPQYSKVQIWGKQNRVVIADGLKLRWGLKFSSKHGCVYITGDKPPCQVGTQVEGTGRCFQTLDLGLSTSQLNVQSCFKRCGRANLLKGLTQPCCPQGNIYGRAVNSSRAALLAAQPCAAFTTCPCFAISQAAPSQLIYCHATQFAGGESGPVVTEQTQGLVPGVQPLAACQQGKSETLKEEGEGGEAGYFLERQSHS